MVESNQVACPVVQQAVGWALHALEPDEEITVAAHVPTCPVCRSAVRETEEVVAGLGAASEQVNPPPTLRSSLMAAVADMPQIPRPRSAPSPSPATPATPVPPSDPAPRRIESADRGRLPASWLSRRKLVVAAMALVAVVSVGGLAVRTAQLDQERVQNAQAISGVLNELVPPGARHAVLATRDGATVGAVVIDNGQRLVVTVGMPANTAEQTYVLWGVAGQNAPVPLGTFDVTAPDAKKRPVGSGADNDGFTAYAVSLEPGRTAPATPSSVMAEGRLA